MLPAQDQRIRKASHAKPDAPLGLGLLLLGRQRIARNVDDIVEQPDRDWHERFEPGLVEPAPRG